MAFFPFEGDVRARAYSGIISVKWPREHLLPLEQGASLLQGTFPQNSFRQLSYIRVPIALYPGTQFTVGWTEVISVKKLAQSFHHPGQESNSGPRDCKSWMLPLHHVATFAYTSIIQYINLIYSILIHITYKYVCTCVRALYRR